MGKIAQKYDFQFVATAPDSPVVQVYFLAHLQKMGYPLTTRSEATRWCAVTRGEGVYAVFGWFYQNGEIVLSDFYTYPGRWGVLAGRAALERVREESDRSGMVVTTATPARNREMIRAYCKACGLDPEEPELVVYRYRPSESAPTETAPREAVA